MDKKYRYEKIDTVVWKYTPTLKELIEKDQKIRDHKISRPDFFICGAAKSGTTSLFNYLGQHPSIFTSAWKEPGYFSALRPMKSPHRYGQLFDEAETGQLIGEASGAYLTSPDSALRISEAVPEAKIIIMLRNPADRAFSLYNWMAKEGYEWVPTFERALRLEEKRRDSVSFVKNNPEYYYNFLYHTTGCYTRQIERFLNAFDREHLRFLIFDDFVESPVSCTKEIFRFLEVDESIKIRTPVRNKGKSVYSVPLQFWLRHRARPVSRKIPLGIRLVRKAMQWNRSAKKPNLSDRCRHRLLQYYEEDIRETSALIGRDLASRWL